MRIDVAEYAFAGGERQQGFIAQQLHEVYPAAVHVGGEDVLKDPWGVDYGRLTPLLVRALQQQQERIDGLERRLEEMAA